VHLGTRTLRCLVVWATATTTLALPAHWLVGRAGAGAKALEDRETSGPAFEHALVGACCVVLLGCLVWAWLAATAVVVEAMASRGAAAPGVASRAVPALLRRVVLSLCGAALAGGGLHPAYAEPGAHHAHRASVMAQIVGLPLPEPVPTAPWLRSSARDDSWVEVTPGDSLWSIAERDLRPGSPASAVVSHWHAIYAANRAAIGPDPDLITAGTRLRLPRKESP
jgi:hypothetical protein